MEAKLIKLEQGFILVSDETPIIDDFVELLKQVREATIQECIRNIQVEHRTYNVNGEYDDYIRGISTNPIAKAVKLRDLEHNSRITRIKGLRKKDFDRLEKYHRAYTYLLD